MVLHNEIFKHRPLHVSRFEEQEEITNLSTFRWVSVKISTLSICVAKNEFVCNSVNQIVHVYFRYVTHP